MNLRNNSHIDQSLSELILTKSNYSIIPIIVYLKLRKNKQKKSNDYGKMIIIEENFLFDEMIYFNCRYVVLMKISVYRKIEKYCILE